MSENPGWLDFTNEIDRQKHEQTGPAKWAEVQEGWKRDELRKKEKAGD